MKIRVVFSEMVDQLTYDMVEKGVVSSYFSYWVAFDPSSLESGLYTGPVNADYYGRLVPKHVTASVRMQGKTASTETVMSAMLESFDRKVCRHIFVRRMGVSANGAVPDDGFCQLDLFTDYDRLEREKRIQRAMLGIRSRYGKNAVLKGMNYLESGTARERNGQIGGHRS